MNNSFLSSRAIMGAAIVGLVGAAGVFIYEQIYAEKRRAMLVREVARLDMQVSSMRTELEALRELQKETARSRQSRRLKQKEKQRRERAERALKQAGDASHAEQSAGEDSEYFTDYQSVAGTDHEMDSEEFYDVHTDDDDDTLRESVRNGHATSVFDDDLSDKAEDLKPIQKNST